METCHFGAHVNDFHYCVCYSYMSIYVKCLQANPVLCLLSCNAHVRINADFWFEHCTIFIYYFKRVIDKAKQTDYKLNEFCTYRVCFNIFLPSAILINLRQLRNLQLVHCVLLITMIPVRHVVCSVFFLFAIKNPSYSNPIIHHDTN